VGPRRPHPALVAGRRTHLHDLGPLPLQPATVCPGLLGGVETPMAYAAGRLFVTVVEFCSQESAVISKSAFARSPAQAEGSGVRTRCGNRKVCLQRRLGSAPFGCATVARDAVHRSHLRRRVTAFASR